MVGTVRLPTFVSNESSAGISVTTARRQSDCSMYRRLMPLISSFNMSLYVSSEFNTDVHVVLLHFDETAVNHLFVSAFRVLIDQPSLFECGDDGRVVLEDFELAACAGNDNALHSSVKYHLFGGNDFEPINRKNLQKAYERYAADPIGYIALTSPQVKVTVTDDNGKPYQPKNMPYNPIEREER